MSSINLSFFDMLLWKPNYSLEIANEKCKECMLSEDWMLCLDKFDQELNLDFNHFIRSGNMKNMKNMM